MTSSVDPSNRRAQLRGATRKTAVSAGVFIVLAALANAFGEALGLQSGDARLLASIFAVVAVVDLLFVGVLSVILMKAR